MSAATHTRGRNVPQPVVEDDGDGFISISQLKAEVRASRIKTAYGKVAVSYKPGLITQGMVEEITEAAGTPDEGPTVRAALETVFVSWGIKAEPTDAEPLPITQDNLRDVPVSLLSELFFGVFAESQPKNERRGSFRNG